MAAPNHDATPPIDTVDDHCSDPFPFAVVRRMFDVRRAVLLDDKYRGLITRSFLRDERWLYYTLEQTAQLMRDEFVARENILQDEHFDLRTVRRYQHFLREIDAAGTEGSVVAIDEACSEERAALVALELSSRDAILSHRRTNETILREQAQSQRDLLLEILYRQEWLESGAREKLEEEEYQTRDATWVARAQDEKRIQTILLWRVVVQECEARFVLEASIDAEWLSQELPRRARAVELSSVAGVERMMHAAAAGRAPSTNRHVSPMAVPPSSSTAVSTQPRAADGGESSSVSVRAPADGTADVAVVTSPPRAPEADQPSIALRPSEPAKVRAARIVFEMRQLMGVLSDGADDASKGGPEATCVSSSTEDPWVRLAAATDAAVRAAPRH